MSLHANGLEIIEVGATAWRIIMNNNFQKTVSETDLATALADLDTIITTIEEDITDLNTAITHLYSFEENYLSSVVGNATVTIDGTEKKLDYLITLGANILIDNPSPMFSVGKKGTILLKQDSTGNRVVTWGSMFKFPNGLAPTLSTTADYVDVIEYICISTDTIICKNITIGIH